MCRTREPNSDRENCVVMWARENYKWADWTCQTVNERNLRFRPLCQKDSIDEDLYDDYDNGDGVRDYDSGDEDDGDIEKVCSEMGVKHKGDTEVDRIMGVYRVVLSFPFIDRLNEKVTYRVVNMGDNLLLTY